MISVELCVERSAEYLLTDAGWIVVCIDVACSMLLAFFSDLCSNWALDLTPRLVLLPSSPRAIGIRSEQSTL